MYAFTRNCVRNARWHVSVSACAQKDDSRRRGFVRKVWARASDQKNSTITQDFLSTENTADGCRDTVTSPQIICSLETVVPYGFIKSSLIFTWSAELFFIHSVGSKYEILPFK